MIHKKYIIVDIDGTIASHDGVRGHHEYDKVYLDKPIPTTIDLINALNNSYNIIYLTGRPESCRSSTELWIRKNVHEYIGGLYMRTTRDHRKDYVVKKELLYRVIDDAKITKEDISFVIDDRLSVIDMWISEGLFVFNVNNGKGEF
jgi:hypothetical protein